MILPDKSIGSNTNLAAYIYIYESNHFSLGRALDQRDILRISFADIVYSPADISVFSVGRSLVYIFHLYFL